MKMFFYANAIDSCLYIGSFITFSTTDNVLRNI